MNLYMLGVGWIVYFSLHSVLASQSVKRDAERLWKGAGRYYRIFYNSVAVVGLVALLMLNGALQSPYYFDREGWVRFLSLVFTTFGVMTIQLAFRQYKLKAFLGFGEEEGVMKIQGILKWVRHPIYSGIILVTLGFFLFIPNLPTLVTCASIFLYLPVGIYLEEKKLIAYFGQDYLDYRKRVPMVLPRLSAFFIDSGR
ncbi:MAG: isoprenylcysteine carboxylmethyltransferase family protein [Cytophagales bacterium]|nr:isoprenylcysteine carboxylmethyltransferase family protein [Cytophagales bacterium]